jgi:hypothetical protein
MFNHKTHYSFNSISNEGILENFPIQNKKLNIYDKISDSNNKIINLIIKILEQKIVFIKKEIIK